MPVEEVELTGDIRNSLINYLDNNTFSRIAILVDENTGRDCLPVINDAVENFVSIEIPSGEKNKNLDTCRHIWTELTHAGFDRHGLLINLGGGVIGDMGGFCAATYKRGISFINIPTTLLAQVDASIGGKLGIDFEGLKNHIGLFTLPDKVFVDPVFLKTLPGEELRSGFAEVIKHSLIADRNYWPAIRDHSLNEQDWTAHINHSIEVKKAIVSKDPLEKGLRKILNFGHTIGHALETHSLNQGNKRLLHGEAVAVGMICELFLSGEKLNMNQSEIKEIQEFILSIYGKFHFEKSSFEGILLLCQQDKKNIKGKINFTLLDSIGSARVNVSVEPEEIHKSLLYYHSI